MDESAADDGGIHRFWAFVKSRNTPLVDLDDLVKLLILIVLFDQVADTIPEPV